MDIAAHLPQQPCVCIHARRIAQKITHFYDTMLQPAGVSVAQYSLLVNIARLEGCGTGELAEQVRLEKSTLVRTLQPLLRNGLITDVSLGTSRKRRLCLTPSGKAVVKKAFPLWTKAQKELHKALGKNHDYLIEIFTALESLE